MNTVLIPKYERTKLVFGHDSIAYLSCQEAIESYTRALKFGYGVEQTVLRRLRDLGMDIPDILIDDRDKEQVQ